MTAEAERQYRSALQQAFESRYKMLASGATALDAMELSVKMLEDEPMFHAGGRQCLQRWTGHALQHRSMYRGYIKENGRAMAKIFR